MSATKHSTEFILKSQISFKDKVILTLGNPFLYPVRSKNAGLKNELHKKLFDFYCASKKILIFIIAFQ